jgi:hypothetical protein
VVQCLSGSLARLSVAAQVGCGLLVLQANPAAAQAGGADSVDSKFLQVGAVRVHYLDFGGRGIPILFMHSGDLSASTYSDFAPRFTDLHRVIAMTERGVPPSEGASRLLKNPPRGDGLSGGGCLFWWRPQKRELPCAAKT